MQTCSSYVDDCNQLCSQLQLQLPVDTAPVSVLVRGGSDCPSSDELDGGSPVSERSATMQVCGAHPHRVQAPKKNAVRWLLRQLQRKQQQQPADRKQQQLPSGTSYGSLSELHEEPCPSDDLQWQQAGNTMQQPVQAVQQQQFLPENPQPDSSSSGQDTSRSCSEGSDSILRRCVKAVLRPVVHALCSAARALASSAGPQGPGNNDNSVAERVINVLTSLPFFAVGLHGLRNRRCPKGRHFALSFVLLGAVASGYHGADRSSWMRPIMRKLDYYTICYTSTVLRRAAHISLPRGVTLASALIAPVKPTLVTGLNLLLVEGKFMRSALAHSHLRSSFKAHIGSAAVGMACFAYEDVATDKLGWPPVLHSLWHCLSALAMGCLHGLLAHLELAVLVEGMQLEAAASN